MNQGRVYLVGAGPGDPGLLTLRGRDVLAQADVVVYDALLSPRLLEYAPAHAERIYVGKRAAQHTLPQPEISALLVSRARTGATVVRLKGGDPYVFGRGGEEALALAEAGIDFEVVPGVTAAIAAAAYAGIPVTHRGLASGVALITGHEADEKIASTLDWAALARFPGTLVFYMGVANLPAITHSLTDNGLAADTPAAVIHWGTTARQKTVTGTLASIADTVAAAALTPPALMFVGRTIDLRQQLNWFERRPLFGKRVVVTRAREQASELAARLEALGAETIEAPAIRIEPPEDPAGLDAAVGDRAAADWIVFTSVNGVDAWFAALARAGLDARAMAGRLVAALGPATAARLAERGLRADLEPAEFTGLALAEAMAARQPLAGVRVLLARADIAPKELALALAAHGASVREVVAYRTVAETAGGDAVREMLDEKAVDWLTFTSSSTVRNFLRAVGADAVHGSGAGIASIGPTTSATLREAGLTPTLEAAQHTVPGLVKAMLGHNPKRTDTAIAGNT
jgi:uroporphyrinogen III methyltransferase/synthase